MSNAVKKCLERRVTRRASIDTIAKFTKWAARRGHVRRASPKKTIQRGLEWAGAARGESANSRPS